MLDINYIKENPENFEFQMKIRNVSINSKEIIRLDLIKRQHTKLLQDLQQDRNKLSKIIGHEKKMQKDSFKNEVLVNEIKVKINNEEKLLYEVNEKLKGILLNLPNIADKEVPEGDENNYKEVFKKKPSNKENTVYAHDEIGKSLSMLDFKNAGRISGSRFVILSSKLARLERALINFMIDLHVEEHGYQEVSTPHLVKKTSLIGTGQLPKFESDLYKVSEDKWLIPTAEVTLTNLHRESFLSEKDLPLRYVAATNCFRSEAGASGIDTKGIIRLHEFKKVELVSIVKQDKSDLELDRLTDCAKKVLELLGLPYRVILLASGDMGFAAAKTYDLEVWVPSQGRYREISSCSNCRDFQARRMNSKYKDINGEKKFVHTLNGSGLAVGRTLLAIMENYQLTKNKFQIPDVLTKYMNGEKEISI